MTRNAALPPARGAAQTTISPTVDTNGSAAVSITPAIGWWWLHTFTSLDGERQTVRHRVACWCLAIGSEWGPEVRPLVAGDGNQLVFVEDVYGGAETDGYLEHDDELGHCVCGMRSHHSRDETDDIWWCRRCAGVIEVD